MGFQPINIGVPTLQESLREAGYLNGIMAKVSHLAPQAKFCWDTVVQADELGSGRDPVLYYKSAREFFDKAKAAGKPFFLMANVQDPHRPFAGSATEGQGKARHLGVSRRYRPEEITVPGFLPQDLADIKVELAQYYTSVHRADESAGQVLKALKDSGLEDNTVVFFLSDNGISMPFAKANCYFTSTATPLIVRWPGKVKPGSVNRDDLVSGVDFAPTVLEITGASPIAGMDGRSLVPLLEGRKQDGRDKVFTFFTRTSAGNDYPMRCVRTKRYSYIFNAWSDGKTRYQAEGMSGLTFKAMEAAAEKDPAIAERVRFLRNRVPEEFYDLRSDPWELKNLINDPAYAETVRKMKADLLEMMISTQDPLLDQFRKMLAK